MPLDPFFSDRLRVHRRYLIGQQLKTLRRRVTAWFDRTRGRQEPKATASRAKRPASPSSAARARHRRAALAWDRKELETVGIPGPDVRTAEHVVPVPGRPSVTVRIYYPEPADPEPADPHHADPAPAHADPDAVAGPVPGWLTFFGGAFRIGGIDYPTTDAGNRRRAADAGVAMVAVAYSLAPEHRFPTQIEQAEAALRWLHGNAAELGIDPDRLGVMGVSAGGSIAAALALVNRDRLHIPIRLQILEVPVTDLTGGHIDLRATRAMRVPSVLAIRELRSVARTYLPRRSDARDPLASPLLAGSHAGLPETMIFTAEYDPLRGDGAAYAARLRADGVEATAVQYLGVTHDVAIFGGVLPAARRWHRDIVAALSRLHDEPLPRSGLSRGAREGTG